MKFIHLTLAPHTTALREDGTIWSAGENFRSARFISQSFGGTRVILVDGTEAMVFAETIVSRTEAAEQSWTKIRAIHDRRAAFAF